MPVIQVAESVDVSLSQEIPSDIWSGGVTSKETCFTHLPTVQELESM